MTDFRKVIEFIKYDPEQFIEYLEQIQGCNDTEYIDRTLEDYAHYYLMDGQFEDWVKQNG